LNAAKNKNGFMRNYLITAATSLKNRHLFSFTKVLGLSIAFISSLLAVAFMYKELNFDKDSQEAKTIRLEIDDYRDYPIAHIAFYKYF
jgi:hypothetical protein